MDALNELIQFKLKAMTSMAKEQRKVIEEIKNRNYCLAIDSAEAVLCELMDMEESLKDGLE